MHFFVLAFIIVIFKLNIINAVPIESDENVSQQFQKRSRGASALGMAAAGVVGAAGLGVSAWAEHKYMQRTGNPVPLSLHDHDSRSSRQRREDRKKNRL
jgi:hypothetical protein